VGVVGAGDDGAICSTGFAVLRPRSITSYTLALLLRSEFSTAQLLRHTMGVAYPAIDERCVLDVLLPADRDAVELMAAESQVYEETLTRLIQARQRFDDVLRQSLPTWAGNP
jgi:type I restriction enzyme S subunit